MSTRPALFALVASLLGAAPASAAPAGAKEFHAVIDGTQTVPPHASSIRGVGHFTLNAEQTELAYEITFSPWTVNEIFSHIHVAAAGNNGQEAIVHDLPDGNPKKGVFILKEPFLLAALFNGHLFVNVHTLQHNMGEVAGYILPGTPAEPATWGRLKAHYSR